MLQKLSIKNYALIDSIDIEFDKGLNIITGETGAGKSIILGALSLILGQRAENKYFFNHDKKCIIEGVFIINSDRLNTLFELLEVDALEETIVRREITSDGRSRAFINDTPVNLTQLKTFGEQLIDVHSQHAVLELSDEKFQLSIVDSVAGHQKFLSAYKVKYKQYLADKKSLNEKIEAKNIALKELDLNRFLFDELEQAKLDEFEQQNLEQELEQINHAELIKSNLNDASQLLSEDESSALNSMKLSVNRLNQISQFHEEIDELNLRLQSAVIELKDIAGELSFLEQKIIHHPLRAEAINERLNLIYGLQQKHRVNSNVELLKIQAELAQSLDNFNIADEEIETLQKKVNTDNQTLQEEAALISKQRVAVFDKVKSEILAVLNKVGMPNSKLEINHILKENNDFDSNGIDKITFHFSANAGQMPAPIHKIASGGELSRFMLAVKSLISKNTALPTLIFDEIDTGISGDTAKKVGLVMEELANQMQIITITHLPQIASKGIAHFHVYKDESKGITQTHIQKLSQEERITKIAEMLSGHDASKTARDNARELLDK